VSSTQFSPEGTPLTPEEQKMVARILGDPFYFPLVFKTWLQWFIENAPGGIAGGGAAGGATPGALEVPIGGVIFWTSATLAANFLWCDGAAYSRTTYNALYQKIGTQFGVGDGSTTFNVPDADGRGIMSWARAGGHAEAATLGATEGQPKSARHHRHAHTTTVTDNGHFHDRILRDDGAEVWTDDGSENGSVIVSVSNARSARKYKTSTNPANIAVASGQPGAPVNDTPAYIVLPAIIRYV